MTTPICLRYQEVRGDRLVYSCECAGEGCPEKPVDSPIDPTGRAPRPACQGDVMPCKCTPTQALDKVEQTLIGRKMRVVGTLGIGLRHTLESLADELAAIGAEESLRDELDALIRNASRGMCIHCGSYGDCPCDDIADQQSTGGY